jgi:hypothetical protein
VGFDFESRLLARLADRFRILPVQKTSRSNEAVDCGETAFVVSAIGEPLHGLDQSYLDYTPQGPDHK